MIFERGHFKSTRLQKSIISDVLNETRMFSNRTARDTKTTVFLSHKHKDLEDEKEAAGIIEMFEDLRVKFYIDSMDNGMPGQTSGETALRIKDEIKYCNKFVLLATGRAIESYWCNWELGIGDVHKFMKNIAIVPIKEKGVYDWQYTGNEYLQIYPYIEFRDGTTEYKSGELIPKGYYVSYPKDKDGNFSITLLKDWLERR